MVIFDISDPADPQLVGRFFSSDAAIISVRVAGSYVYIARNNGLQIVDVSNPRVPLIARFYSTRNYAAALNIVDNYVYLAEGGQLHIIDLSNPLASEVRLFSPQDGKYYHIRDVVVLGSNVYLPSCYYVRPNNSYGILQIVNVSTPSNPYVVNNYNLENKRLCLDIVGKANNVLYLTGRYNLWQVDVTDPFSPQLINQYNVPDWTQKVVGDYAYIAFGSDLLLIDLTKPTGFAPDPRMSVPNQRWDVAVIGNYAYFVEKRYEDTPRLRVYDISEPDKPILTYESDF